MTDTVYRERAHLVAHLAALYPSHIGRTDTDEPEWSVVTIETPTGQMCWHISDDDLDLFTHVQPTNRICRAWDGHTTDEKYGRLRTLTVQTKPVPLIDPRTSAYLQAAEDVDREYPGPILGFVARGVAQFLRRRAIEIEQGNR
ncbi:hypothetical protein [Streptomyces sp. UH6]|uniref:WDGH domain-containing protein n=1 Tax=Streptomyces sp. UH6 TaxID=2748379 RepID=UPI0015D4F406|nr:hypothetical protein [Streptomyces sp. UH6]NYV72959.1 hypothetical protein [Streptomyces sp. UH6]